MKNVNSIKIAWIFAGCFLGAGLVSGQEVWQFFGAFGNFGTVGIILSVALLALLGMMAMRMAAVLDTEEMDKVIVPDKPRIFAALSGVLQAVFLFGVVVIMVAGAGALVEMITGIPSEIACAVFVLMLMIIALLGKEGVSTVFSVSVPLIVVLSLVISVVSLFIFKPDGSEHIPRDNDLLPNWFISAIAYATCNIFSSIGILSPFGKIVKNKHVARMGIILGSLVVVAMCVAISSAMRNYPSCLKEDLPMLELAMDISLVAGIIYGILLMCGMFGTSLSCSVAVITYLQAKSEKLRKNKVLLTVVLGAVAYALSLAGFGNLVGTVYPIFGYVSAVFLIVMTNNYFKIIGKNKKTSAERTNKL